MRRLSTPPPGGRAWIAVTLALCAGALSACSTPAASGPRAQPAGDTAALPALRLPPAALQRTLALQQRIVVRYRDQQGEQRREVVALLQADARHTRVAAIAGGQVLARLDWDGSRLQVQRSPWAPRELDPERILNDLQLTLWPLPAIAAALPAGWRIDGTPRRRVLSSAGQAVAEVDYPDDSTIVLHQHRDGYTLTISTLPTEGMPQ